MQAPRNASPDIPKSGLGETVDKTFYIFFANAYARDLVRLYHSFCLTEGYYGRYQHARQWA